MPVESPPSASVRSYAPQAGHNGATRSLPDVEIFWGARRALNDGLAREFDSGNDRGWIEPKEILQRSKPITRSVDGFCVWVVSWARSAVPQGAPDERGPVSRAERRLNQAGNVWPCEALLRSLYGRGRPSTVHIPCTRLGRDHRQKGHDESDRNRPSLSAPDHFFIGGEWVKPSNSDQIDVINSSTENVFFRVAEAKAEDMDRAITAAREAFGSGTLAATDPRRAGGLHAEDRRRPRRTRS